MVVGHGLNNKTVWGAVWQSNTIIGKIDTTMNFSFDKDGISSKEVQVQGALRVAVLLPGTGSYSTPSNFCRPHLGSFCGVGLVSAGY